MDLFFYFFLFIFWTMFGSFASVVIYRLKSGEGGIWAGRSHCKTCERDLSVLELIPVLSWTLQWGKCKGCKSKISAIYPLLEICMGILFVATGYFLIDSTLIFMGNGFEWIRMFFFLSIMFFTVIYVFYDILYLEIPESILGISNKLTFGVLIAQGFGLSFIPYLATWSLDIITLGICITIIALLYTIMLAELREIYDALIVLFCMILLGWYIHITGGFYGLLQESALLSGTLAAFIIFVSFFLQIVLSGGRAMWAGDLRIAILMGLLVWIGFAFQAWMICYLAWSIIGIWIIIYAKIKDGIKAPFQHQIPFWPFIAAWYLAVLFFHNYISKFIEWYI